MNTDKLKELACNIDRNIKKLAKLRSDHISIYKEITRYICPERGRYPSYNNKLDGYNSINSKANKYLHNLASILQSGLTSPARPWFKLALQNKKVYEWGAVRSYLSEIEEIMSRILE